MAAAKTIGIRKAWPGTRSFRTFFREWGIILAFTLSKFILQLATATNYGFQRDAYLYMSQARNLDWGYFSTPPLLAFLIRIHTAIWGDSLLAMRLLPALVGTLSIFLVGWLIKNLKGKSVAQLLGLSAFLLSPAFLRPAGLVQPVILNHLFWLLAAVVVVQVIRRQDSRLLLWLIPVLGLGWLNKYSIVFYALALLLALAFSPQRKLLWSKYLLYTLAGGLLLILPNLWWQQQHSWPVLHHMSALQETQLVHVGMGDFLLSQVFMAMPALTIWMGGLIFLLVNREYRAYRPLAWAFLFTLAIILLMRGKFYYTIGAYTILVVFGGLAWERWGRKPRRFLIIMVLSMNLNIGLSILPFSLPIYAPDRMIRFDEKMIDRGMDMMLTWEDGEVHALPQDYADMLGWDELGTKVWNFYDTLPDSVRSRTWVYGENYGAAGAMDYWRPDRRTKSAKGGPISPEGGSISADGRETLPPEYPEVHSFNDAFMFWVPPTGEFDHLIYVGYSDRIPLYFEKLERVGKVENPHFREHGLPIWFGSKPTDTLHADWKGAWENSAGQFNKTESNE